MLRTRSAPLPLLASLAAFSVAGPLATPLVAQAEREDEADAKPLVVPGRSMVATTMGIVASSSPLAASAGVQVLERGGNAIDAAIAANAVTGLTEPMSFTIGGDLFALVYIAAEDRLYGLNASGWSPAALTPELLASKGVERMSGVWSVTVPGTVAGWQAMRDRFGRLPFSESLAPAIWYAENGFPVTQTIAGMWGRAEEHFAEDASGKATYLLPGGRAPAEGELMRNPSLARTYRRIAEQGRDGFYQGPVAEAIVGVLGARGGVMTMADLAEFEPEWQEPISTTYRGWTVWEMPPQGQGIGALMMLNLMERFPLAEWGYKSTRSLHAMMEAKKLAYADILKYVGDPRFGDVPVEEMLSKERAAERAGLIDMGRAACSVEPGRLAGVTDSEGDDTIYLTVVDRDGNIVSLISSVYSVWGSRIVPEDTGFVLHNRGSLFTLTSGQPNTLAPRKRPLHTIIPAFMEREGTRIGFGIMGGWNQAQAHAQFVSNIADYGLNIQEALEAGRFTQGSFTGCGISVEHLIPAEVRDGLTALGHEIRVPDPRSGTFGWGQVVMSTPSGVKFGASEPRHDGLALPEPAPAFGGGQGNPGGR